MPAVRTLAGLLAVVLLASCGGGSSALHGLQRAEPLEVGTVTLPEVTPAGAATPFTMKAPDGKLLVVYFGYTSCPDLCPTTLNDVRTALGQMGASAKKVDLAMVTVDPKRDTPAVLNTYLAGFVDQYHALRTEDPSLLASAEASFLASSTLTPKADGTYDVSHTAITYVVDQNGRVLVEWPFGVSWRAMQADLEHLVAKVRA